jgi:tetratricopeptide (TPR) repeat protein
MSKPFNHILVLLFLLGSLFPARGQKTDFYDAGLKAIAAHNWNTAIVLFTKSIHAGKEVKESFYYRGFALDSIGEYRKAKSDYLTVVGMDPGFHLAWCGLGYSCFMLEEYTPALKYLSKALTLKPHEPWTLYYRALCQYRLHNYSKAVADFTRLIDTLPVPEGYLFRSFAWGRLGNHRAELNDLQKVLESDPVNAIALSNAGSSLFALGKYDSAMMYSKRCLAADTTDLNAYLNLAICCYVTGDTASSVKWIKAAGKADPRVLDGMKGIDALEKDDIIIETSEEKAVLKKIFYFCHPDRNFHNGG